ncbi:MAG: Uma2 family endonuclease [Pseudonocardiales bacterium]|nr:Uma2 family endonuclease [Pseudonocardiales bacterium]
MTAEAVPLVPPPQGWTISDIDRLPENGLRYELVDGVPRVMSPPKIRHQHVLRRLANTLEAAAPVGLLVVEGIGVVLASDQRPIPDLVVIRGTDPDSELSDVPAAQVVLAAEIVSRSSRSDDRFRKPAQYAQAGIPVYLRVELDPSHVVGYRIGPDGLYIEAGRAEPGQSLVLDEPFPITIDPGSLLR